MKALLLVNAGSNDGPPLPPEAMQQMLAAFAAWREQWKPHMESFYFFVQGKGGCGVIDTPDEATMFAMCSSFPFAPFSDMRLMPVMDGDVALANLTRMFAQMMQGSA